MTSVEEQIRTELFDELYELQDFATEVSRTMRDQDTRVDVLRALYRRIAQLEDELEIEKWNGQAGLFQEYLLGTQYF